MQSQRPGAHALQSPARAVFRIWLIVLAQRPHCGAQSRERKVAATVAGFVAQRSMSRSEIRLQEQTIMGGSRVSLSRLACPLPSPKPRGAHF